MWGDKKKLTLLVLSVWLAIVVIFMALANILNVEILFVLWLIGILVIIELIDSPYLSTSYIKNLKIVISAGVGVFGLIVAFKVLEIISR
ncbi:hypothetical protein [Methanoplanus endosymbiosus]|jgi:hypothetical protein|uniref:Uncharacterized protein n=1 Tax=Methanoplanus endosymbiosus TaxID=33865 RepID=A0A9E7PL53_9EURY|nr:hypothetical protein [Methanoplanus endosymbiosus]UUX92183.1 hypothetical protein L6E24_12615 [Methanoplanus endosymbiosus]